MIVTRARKACAAGAPRTVREQLMEAWRALGTLNDPELPVVSIVAPPGFGKTTLLAQWEPLDGRPVAWGSLCHNW